MTKTIWRNSEGFENKINNVEDETSSKDIEKIKSIRKKKLLRENYKNIEILKNIYDDDDNNNKATPSAATTAPPPPAAEEDLSPPSSPPPPPQNSIEGFDINELYDKYITSTYNKFSFSFPFGSIDNHIDVFGRFGNFYTKNIQPELLYFINLLNGDDIDESVAENDLRILENHFCIILSFPFIVCMTYNWQFLLTYDFINDEDNVKERPAGDDKRLNITFKVGEGGPVSEIAMFFFEMMIKPLYYLDKGFLGDNFLPKFLKLSPYLPLNCAKIMIIFMVFFFVRNLNFFQIYNSFLAGNEESVVEDLLTDNTAVNYVLLIFSSVIIFIHTMLKLYEWGVLVGSKMMGGLFAILLGIFAMIVIIALYVIVALLSLKISSLVILIYLWFHSLFGLLAYEEKKIEGGIPFYTRGKSNWKSMENRINQELNTLINEKCGDDDWWKTFKEVVYFYLVNIFTITFLSIISNAFLETIFQISTTAIIIILSTIYVILFICIWAFILKKSPHYYNYGENMIFFWTIFSFIIMQIIFYFSGIFTTINFVLLFMILLYACYFLKIDFSSIKTKMNDFIGMINTYMATLMTYFRRPVN